MNGEFAMLVDKSMTFLLKGRCKVIPAWDLIDSVLCSSNLFSKLDIRANVLVVCHQHYTLILLFFTSTTGVIIQIGSFSKLPLYNMRGRKLHVDESQQHLLITKTFFIHSTVYPAAVLRNIFLINVKGEFHRIL